MSTGFSVRVRRGEREVEVSGTEEFVRDMFETLVEDYLTAPRIPAAGATQSESGGAALLSLDGEPGQFRDLLNRAKGATAPQRCLMAAVVLYKQGVQSVGRDDIHRMFEEAMESQINFYREAGACVKAGWMTKVSGDEKRYRVTNSGLHKVNELAGVSEGT